MIGIVDYGMGNLLSVYNAIEILGEDALICAAPDALSEVEKIILPGVGAFGDCMKNLHNRKFVEALHSSVFIEKKPILGICLGMQAMARKSFEGGREHKGLGWFDADVVRLRSNVPSLKIPHVGWNDITFKLDNPLFLGLPDHPDVYFVHSYFMDCDIKEDVIATCDYGDLVTAAVRREHIFATQFHPEKSQDHGLKILENFINWLP